MEQKSFLGPQYEVTIKKPTKQKSKPLCAAHFSRPITICALTNQPCIFADGLWCHKEDRPANFISICDFNK